MDSSLFEPRQWLVDKIEEKAGWCQYQTSLFPDSACKLSCTNTLHSLASLIEELPDNHPLFSKLERIQHLNGNAQQRWLDELNLEFSYIGYQFSANDQQAIQRLVEVADSSF